MATDWSRWCRSRPFEITGRGVRVHLADGRRHVVRVEEFDDSFRLTSIVTRTGASGSAGDLALEAWRRNRLAKLVGFRVDERGRLLGEAALPKAGLTAEEFRLRVRHLATECDRLEYLIEGGDRE